MRWNLSVAGLASSWGFIAVIVVAVDLSATVLVFYRLAIAAVTIALLVAAVRRPELLRVREQRGWVLVLGVGLAGHWYLYFETIKLSSVAVALLTIYTAPIFIALLAPLFLPEARSRVAALALAPAMGGLALIALAGGEGAHARPLAIAAGLGAAVSYAVLVIITKHITARVPIPAMELWTYAIASVTLAPFLAGSARVLPHLGEAGYVVLLGALFTAISGLVWVFLLRRVTAQTIGVLAYLEVVSGALLAWPILGQPLGWAVIAGGLLVVAAGLGVVLYEPADAAAVEVPAPMAEPAGARIGR